jgi:DNA-binding transcriptional ArsR family regulator
MTGTRSGADHAGTVQEIDEFRNSGKPVLLYFSSVPVVSGSVDPEEYKSLLQFKSACRRHGLTEDYGSIPELREKLLRHLTGAVKDAHREPGSVPTPLQFPAKIVFKGAPPESRLEEEKIRILQTIAQIEAQRGGPVEAAKLSALLHMSVPRVRYHLGELENEEYVHGSYWAPEYGLDQKGQDYLVKSKLLGRVPHG